MRDPEAAGQSRHEPLDPRATRGTSRPKSSSSKFGHGVISGSVSGPGRGVWWRAEPVDMRDEEQKGRAVRVGVGIIQDSARIWGRTCLRRWHVTGRAVGDGREEGLRVTEETESAGHRGGEATIPLESVCAHLLPELLVAGHYLSRRRRPVERGLGGGPRRGVG